MIPSHSADGEHLAGSEEREDGEEDEHGKMPSNAHGSFGPTEERYPAPGAEMFERRVEAMYRMHAIKVANALGGISRAAMSIEILR